MHRSRRARFERQDVTGCVRPAPGKCSALRAPRRLLSLSIHVRAHRPNREPARRHGTTRDAQIRVSQQRDAASPLRGRSRSRAGVGTVGISRQRAHNPQRRTGRPGKPRLHREPLLPSRRPRHDRRRNAGAHRLRAGHTRSLGGHGGGGVPRHDDLRAPVHDDMAHKTGAIILDRRAHRDFPHALSRHCPRCPTSRLARGRHDLPVRKADQHPNPTHCRSSLPALLLLLQAATTTAPQTPAATVPLWTVHLSGDIRWQQTTPAGALLVSTDGALAAVDIDRGQIAWQKPELGGLPVDSVHMIEGSLLMEAAKPGLSLIFDPVTGTVLFDSRHLSLASVVTRRVLPQTGTLLVHGQRASGPPLVALYDLATGTQRWVSESLFQQTEQKRGGLGGLMQGLVRMASAATTLEVLQAGPDVIVVHTLMGLRALDAKTGAIRWTATLPMTRSGAVPHQVKLYPSLTKSDRIYVSYDDRLMAYRLADGQPLWAQPANVDGWIRNIVQHPAGIIMLNVATVTLRLQ